MSFIPTDYQERQELLKKDQDRIEAFKSNSTHVFETFFKDEKHVRKIVQIMQINVGDVGKDWFSTSPFGMCTGDIIKHNQDADENQRVRQYLYIGVKQDLSEIAIDRIKRALNMQKLKNLGDTP